MLVVCEREGAADDIPGKDLEEVLNNYKDWLEGGSLNYNPPEDGDEYDIVIVDIPTKKVWVGKVLGRLTFDVVIDD